MTGAKWDRRIRRATELTSAHPFAAEGLRFYTRIATFQRSLYTDIQKARAARQKFPPIGPSATNSISFSFCRNFPVF